MTDDFERQLRTMFAESSDPQRSEEFDRIVRARIARLRVRRHAVSAAGFAIAVLALAVLGGPLAAAGASSLTEAFLPLSNAPAAWLLSPMAYVLGALTVVGALVDALRD